MKTRILKTVKTRGPANIAFIKYWGQRNKDLILPYNDSFSMNLSHCYTLVTVQLLELGEIKELFIKDWKSKRYKREDKGKALEKVVRFYQRAKKFLKLDRDYGLRVYSEINFPRQAGIASSASFFSGLALGLVTAFEKKISQKDLSVLARLSGSGSACRSIPDGFVWWFAGKGDEIGSSYAKTIFSSDFWNLVDMVLILGFKKKETTSQSGHQGAVSSSLFKYRLLSLKERLKKMKRAFRAKDFSLFGSLLEEEAVSLHSVMMTQRPPLYYWSGETVEIIKEILFLRRSGIAAYYTVDAGENIHLICQKKDKDKIYDYFSRKREVKEIIVNYPGKGARVLVNE